MWFIYILPHLDSNIVAGMKPLPMGYWVYLSKRGGKDEVFQGLAGPTQPEENPALRDSFTQIYILFLVGFRIDPPKMHGRFIISFITMEY